MKIACAMLLLIATWGIAAQQPPATSPVKSVQVSKEDLAKRIISAAPRPEYPQEAKASRVQGTVVLEVVVDKEGRVARIKAVSGPRILRDSCERAVKKWTYQPMTRDGEPVEMISTVEVGFTIL